MKKAIIIFTILLLIIIAFVFLNDKENRTTDLFNSRQSSQNTQSSPINSKDFAADESKSDIKTNTSYQDSSISEEQKINAEKKVTLLKEILNSKNDNDPRIDTELKVLDNVVKSRLINYYKSLNKEQLNERGTVVFLMGRNLTTPQDLNFLKEVLNEGECLSLSNCTIAEGGSDPHHQGTEATTLAYPQLMALLALDKLLSGNPTAEQKKWALDQLQESSKSPITLVQRKAENLLLKHNK